MPNRTTSHWHNQPMSSNCSMALSVTSDKLPTRSIRYRRTRIPTNWNQVSGSSSFWLKIKNGLVKILAIALSRMNPYPIRCSTSHQATKRCSASMWRTSTEDRTITIWCVHPHNRRCGSCVSRIPRTRNCVMHTPSYGKKQKISR